MSSYDEACRYATTSQGLDPVVDAFHAAGLPMHVAQTGGFTMVAVLKVADGIVAVTRDDDDDTAGRPTYLVGHHPGDTWLVAYDDTDVDYRENQTLDQAIDFAESLR